MLNACQIVYHHNNCLNAKKAYSKPCRLCVDACPHGAISEFRELDTQKCTECGACMAVCPSDGFVDQATNILHRYIDSNEDVVLNCPLALPLGFEIPCLGILDRDLWMVLMERAQKNKVTIHTGHCAQCPDKKACGLSVKVFKELHSQWPDHGTIQIKITPDNGEELVEKKETILKTPVPPKENKTWRKKGWEKLETILPGLKADEAYLIPLTRQLLLKRMEYQPEMKWPILSLHVKRNCTSCGVCGAICPQGALTKREEGEELTLIYEPYKCVHCMRCVNVCNPKALVMDNKFLAPRFFKGKIQIHKGGPSFCSRCGKKVFDNSEPPLCIACSSSAWDSILNS